MVDSPRQNAGMAWPGGLAAQLHAMRRAGAVHGEYVSCTAALLPARRGTYMLSSSFSQTGPNVNSAVGSDVLSCCPFASLVLGMRLLSLPIHRMAENQILQGGRRKEERKELQ